MQIAFAQRLPFIAVEPNPFAAVTMVERERKIAADKVFDHAKATLGTINRQTRLSQRQVFVFNYAFRQIGAVLFNPIPVFSSGNPITPTARALLRTKILFQLF